MDIVIYLDQEYRHRVINFNDDLRITLCTTPEENPYTKDK